jgi:hypothetical protein
MKRSGRPGISAHGTIGIEAEVAKVAAWVDQRRLIDLGRRESQTLSEKHMPPVDPQITPIPSRATPTLGPSDSSDSGPDLIGTTPAGHGQLPDLPADLAGAAGDPSLDTTDRYGTGERMTLETEEVQEAADIGFDRVVDAAAAGLGGGLDQAEEAQLGITDEELEKLIGDT